MGRDSGTIQRVAARHTVPLVAALALLGGCGAGGGGGGADGSGEADIDADRSDSSQPPSQSGGARPGPIDGSLPRADLRADTDAYPYRADSPHAPVLQACALLEEEVSADDACTLATLPFLSQESGGAPPSIEQIMNRVLVTHDWMGERLEALLRAAPPELVTLFGSVTSIAIGSSIRPSNYWVGTGGVQLDPYDLWLTVPEKQNVSVEADYRSEYGRPLAFRFLATRRIGEAPAREYFDLEDREERALDDILVPMMSLLFHELAHANDFLPPGGATYLDSSLQPFEALLALRDMWLSPQLSAEQPLLSTQLIRLADVRYGGAEASEADRSVTPDVVGAEMANDGATQFYSYTTIREDFANLFEAAMLKREYDVDVYVGVTNQPSDFENFTCEELLVAWGVRKRLGDPAVGQRAKSVLERIYGPSAEFDAFFAAQSGTQSLMTDGVDWCTNRSTDKPSVMARSGSRTVEGLGHQPMSSAERHRMVAARRTGTGSY